MKLSIKESANPKVRTLPSTHITLPSCIAFYSISASIHECFDQFTTIGSLLKTSAVVGFLLLLPALVHCYRSVLIFPYTDKNCSTVAPSLGYVDVNQTSNVTFFASYFPFNTTETFESAILKNVTGDVLSLVACQVGLPCNAPGAIQISFNLSDIGACSTAGPPGTQFDRLQFSS